jgi:hypothetical protein
VAADHFDLHAKLGFLLGAFSKTIEAEITKNLDDLLAKAPRPYFSDSIRSTYSCIASSACSCP